MRWISLWTWLLWVLVACPAWDASAETLALQDDSCQRKLHVLRHYEIVVQKDKPAVADVPAMLSFWGQTNWQVITSSSFKYSEPPDKVEVTSDYLRMPRRYYHMTWNVPKSDKITVDQTMEVELTCFGKLYTSAKLPYPPAVSKRLAVSLGVDEKEGVNPENKDLGPICDPIVKRFSTAEEVVEGVCDWVNEHIRFEDVQGSSDEVLARRTGCCDPMARLACAMLRRIGIPAEFVPAKFIQSKGCHGFIEVYFPDAGWIFYDLSNWNRGFKSLDCLMTVGYSFRSGASDNPGWTAGLFCEEKDTVPFTDRSNRLARLIRKSPEGLKVASVTVVREKPPSSMKTRQRSLRALLLDPVIPPGPRVYSDNTLPLTPPP